MTEQPPPIPKKGNRGIPTMYAGIMFRSRLEARWAVMFDSLGWKWSYETIDLAWYVPDFILKFEHAPISVEVKPELRFEDLKTYAGRVVASGWKKEILVVGAEIFDGDVIGVLGDDSDVAEGGELVLGPGVVFACINCGLMSLLHGDASYRCRVSGCYGGAAHVGTLEPEMLRAKWLAAANRVQWKGPLSDQPGVR